MIRAVVFGLLIAAGATFCSVASVADHVKTAFGTLFRTSFNSMRVNTNSRLNSDLQICNINASSLVASKLIGGVIGLGVPGFSLAMLQTTGASFSFGMNILIPVIAAVLASCIRNTKFVSCLRRGDAHFYTHFRAFLI